MQSPFTDRYMYSGSTAPPSLIRVGADAPLGTRATATGFAASIKERRNGTIMLRRLTLYPNRVSRVLG